MKERTPHLRPQPLRVLVAALALVAFAACAETHEELPTSPPTLESGAAGAAHLQDFGPAIQAANRHTARLMANPGIVGTGVGLNEDGKPSVRLFLAHGNVGGLPARLDDVPVSIEVTGLFMIRQDRTAHTRPAPIGFSVGHPDVTAGTFGARVTDGTNVFILSNNHVLANSNNASIGDATLQPGAFDGGSEPGDVIGTLHDFYQIQFGGTPNEMDAAISLVDPADVSGSTPETAGYGSPSTNTANASVGMGVQKYGRTTGHTTGTVEEVNVTVSVCFVARGPFNCAQSATFVNQFTIVDGSFSDGGDSGSLIVTTGGNNPVGLLFAGSSTRTIANPINAVLSHFGVTIDPTVPDGSDPDPDDPDPDDPDPDDPDPDDPADIDLAVDGYKVRGVQNADLTWSGAGSAQVDITRNGALIATVANDGFHHDVIGGRGGGSYTYQVCEAGTDTCSAEVTITF